MYLNILKKDLKRKKAMNAILLVFVILATMFVSSSVNNILTVTTALDSYMDMANAPDYLCLGLDAAAQVDIPEIMDNAPSIDSYVVESALVLGENNLIVEDEENALSVSFIAFHSDKALGQNYFLSDNSILETVQPGEIYMNHKMVEALEMEPGDKITVEVNEISMEFTLADGIRDAALNSTGRLIVSEEDFKTFRENDASKPYCASIYYIHTDDVEATKTEIADTLGSFMYKYDRAGLKSIYIMDMVVTGILLVVSIMLIAIAFVVLRFTIGFTLAEEFREIGVMKAIGIRNLKIRGLYLVKYAAISVVGAAIGLVFSFPFGKLLMSVASKSIIMGTANPLFVNFLCALLVIATILLFCFRCTRKVKKMTPIDAIRNGQTGERFRKKSLMNLGKSRLNTSGFLAMNDIVSSPKRFGIVILTFFLCLSLMLILSVTVYTMQSGSLYTTFSYAEFDMDITGLHDPKTYHVENGRELLEEDLAEMEEVLEEEGMEAICLQELVLKPLVTHGENEETLLVIQGVGTTMEDYQYTAGTMPQHADEIAITRMSAQKLDVGIGDTITIHAPNGEMEFIITGYFQTMLDMGDGILLHTDAQISYAQAADSSGLRVLFTDDPDQEELERRMDVIRDLYPDAEVQSCKKIIADMLGVTDILDAVKMLVMILTILLGALITVLMERSFIAKERGEIALLKAIGTRNGKIYAYHVLRFAFVGLIAVILGVALALPMTHLAMDPVFKKMGMELAVNYLTDLVEMYLVIPAIVLVTTVVSAFFTSLYTKTIKSSDTANIE